MNEVNTAATEARFNAYLSALLRRSDRSGLPFPTFSDTLPQRDRHLLIIQNLDAQVGNGGFGQYHENGHLERDYAPLMLALGRLKTEVQGEDLAAVTEVEQLMDRALRHVANCDNPERLTDTELDYLDGLDDRFSALSDRFRPAHQGYFLAWA